MTIFSLEQAVSNGCQLDIAEAESALEEVAALRAENERLRACFDWANGAAEEGWLPAQEVRKLRTQLAEAQRERDKAIDLLETMFSSYENGTACYEDPEDYSGFVGYAFKMDDLDFNACCDLLNRTQPRAAIDAAKGEKNGA